MTGLPQRRLGRTGLELPVLGLGAMDTPHSPEAKATVTAALDHGLRLIDTAREYEGSEFLLGGVIRERGIGDAVLATKTFRHSADGAQYEVDDSLRVLGVERIPLYQLHDISTREAWDEVMAPGGALEGLKTAQYRGLIEHIGISSHNLDLVREAILSGEFDTVMLEYSAFYTESAPLIELASEEDVGVIVMRPLGGSGRTSVMRGRQEAEEAGELTPANLLRYVVSHLGVSVAIPGARYPDRVDQNVATLQSFAPMDHTERIAIEAAAARLY